METPAQDAEVHSLIAYRKEEGALSLEPAARTREWMESLPDHFAYRCLPLLIANQAGWFMLNDSPF